MYSKLIQTENSVADNHKQHISEGERLFVFLKHSVLVTAFVLVTLHVDIN